MEPPALSPDSGCDEAALADIAAGRTVVSESVARWLGGWALARGVADGRAAGGAIVRTVGGDRDGPNVEIDDPSAGRPQSVDLPSETALVWTETALTQCHHLRQRLARFGGGGEQRVAAVLVAAMVTLIVDGAGLPAGPADWPLSTALHLRINVRAEEIAVLGVRWNGRLV